MANEVDELERVNSTEMNRRCAYYFTRVEAGESLVVTRQGRPIAVIRPLNAAYTERDAA